MRPSSVASKHLIGRDIKAFQASHNISKRLSSLTGDLLQSLCTAPFLLPFAGNFQHIMGSMKYAALHEN